MNKAYTVEITNYEYAALKRALVVLERSIKEPLLLDSLEVRKPCFMCEDYVDSSEKIADFEVIQTLLKRLVGEE